MALNPAGRENHQHPTLPQTMQYMPFRPSQQQTAEPQVPYREPPELGGTPNFGETRPRSAYLSLSREHSRENFSDVQSEHSLSVGQAHSPESVSNRPSVGQDRQKKPLPHRQPGVLKRGSLEATV